MPTPRTLILRAEPEPSGEPWELFPSWTFFTFDAPNLTSSNLIHLRTPEGFVRFNQDGTSTVVAEATRECYRGLMAVPFSEAVLKR